MGGAARRSRRTLPTPTPPLRYSGTHGAYGATALTAFPCPLGAKADAEWAVIRPALSATEDFWTEWADHAAYQPGPYRAAVDRSLVTLKALTYEPTGGIVAAATTSLPEEIGGVRNWDWREPDNGLWEVRGDRQHFTHSKVMAWAAADRMARSVRTHGLPGPAPRWEALRDQIHHDVITRGFDAGRNTFTQAYGSAALDASLLLIPRVGFLPAQDPRVLGTIGPQRQPDVDYDNQARSGDRPDHPDRVGP